MSQEYVTGMKLSEYTRVFGGDLTPFHPDEVVIDIGSGLSELKGLASDGFVVQVDPIYSEFISDPQRALVPGRIGVNSEESARNLPVLEKINAHRVTIANTLRYLTAEEKTLAITQILQLSRNGIAQIYPVKDKVVEDIIEDAECLGFGVVAQAVSLSGLRQLAYKVGRINTTLSIVEQPKKVGPSDRRRVAQVIAKGL
jgi:hypothetical protein